MWYDIPTIPTSLLGQSTIITFGDSITDDLYTPKPDYTDRLELYLEVVATNLGDSGSPMQNTNQIGTGLPKPDNGRDRYAALMTGVNNKDIAVIMYGTNDLGWGVETNWTLELFKADYQEVITGLIADGYSASRIVLCTPPWIENYEFGGSFTGGTRAEHLLYKAAVRELAVSNNTLFADCFAATDGNTDAIQVDQLHPSEEGHRFLTLAILNAGFVS